MLYCPKLLIRGGETQRVYPLAQEPNIGVVKKKLTGLIKDVIFEEDVK